MSQTLVGWGGIALSLIEAFRCWRRSSALAHTRVGDLWQVTAWLFVLLAIVIGALMF